MPAGEAPSFEDILPEPGRFWIRHAPRSWPGPQIEWVDLARNRLAGKALREPVDPGCAAVGLGDVVYLPPAVPAAGLGRQHIAEECAQRGLPVVAQIVPGEVVPAVTGTVVLDLTDALLRRRFEAITVPEGVWCVWPLIPGLSDDPALVSWGLERLAAAAVSGVRPVVPELEPEVRRRLARYGGVASYQELFHRNEKRERDVIRQAARMGLAVQPRRPETGGRRGNRRLAAHFSLLADLWLSCGRPEGRGQEFFRAARRIEEEVVDLEELARRGGLGSIGWLDPAARRELAQRVAAGLRPTDLEAELVRELAGTEQAER